MDLSPFISQFDRMVRRDGGKVSLIEADDKLVKVGYRPGHDPECEDGVCIMPHLELQQMMQEALARRDPDMRVQVLLQQD